MGFSVENEIETEQTDCSNWYNNTRQHNQVLKLQVQVFCVHTEWQVIDPLLHVISLSQQKVFLLLTASHL